MILSVPSAFYPIPIHIWHHLSARDVHFLITRHHSRYFPSLTIVV